MINELYRVVIAGVDFTSQTKSISISIRIEDDSTVDIDIVTNYFSYGEDKLPELKRGNKFSVEFGYVGQTTKTIKGTVLEVNETLKNGENILGIKGANKGFSLKRNSSLKVYNNITLAGLVKHFAETHDLDAVIKSKSQKIWDCVPQGNMSDFKLLQYLVRRDGGDDIIYCDNNEIYFVPIGYSNDSKIDSGKFNIKSLLLTHKKISNNKTDSESFTSDQHTESSVTKFLPEGVVNFLQEKEKNPKNTYSAVTGKLAKKGKGQDDSATNNSNGVSSASANIVAGNSDEVKSLQTSSDKQRVYEEVDVDMIGEPTLNVNTYITLSGYTKRFNGKWFIDEINHEISSDGFFTKLKLNKIGHIYKNDADNGLGQTDKQGEVGMLDKIKKSLGLDKPKEPKDTYSAITGKKIK